MIVSIFAAIALIVFIGTLIRYFFPQMDVDNFRLNLNKLVLNVFLPCLNFEVIYLAHIGDEIWKVMFVAFCIIVVCLSLGAICYKWIALDTKTKNVFILGCAFANVTGLGLSVLQGFFPSHHLQVTEVVILFEITMTPLNLITGACLAAYSNREDNVSILSSLKSIAMMPLIWSMVIAMILNLLKVPVPNFIIHATTVLGAIVPGVMVFALGLAIKYKILLNSFSKIHLFLPIILIKLIASPIIAYFIVKAVNLNYPFSSASILEASMPTQLFTIVVADRYKLNTELIAVVITLDSILSFITMPLIRYLLVA
jgi:predicted permease